MNAALLLSQNPALLLGQDPSGEGFGRTALVLLILAGFAGLVLIIVAISFAAFGKVWFQAYMSSADVSMLALVGMWFRQVNMRIIVQAKIMAAQSGLDISRRTGGITTNRLEAHYLAGGNVMNVIHAIIAAQRKL